MKLTSTHQHNAMNTAYHPDHLIYRAEFCAHANVCSETVRRWIHAGVLPPFDWSPTRKRQAWKASTLAAKGFVFAPAAAAAHPAS